MVRVVVPSQDEAHLADAVRLFAQARSVAALTGAGISVESGIPDFRSPGGVWTLFDPAEYATIEVFRQNPAKAWVMYRALCRELAGKQPNAAHRALARLEQAARLDAVVTQNIDGLHQAAGNRTVLEIHGNHARLQCLDCGHREPLAAEHLAVSGVPACPQCGGGLKPDFVLFGEDVREMHAIERVMARCELLLVIGTSATVHPAAGLPGLVKARGGLVFEFNLEPTDLTRGRVGGWWAAGRSGSAASSDWLFQGPASATVPLLVDAVLAV